MGKGAVRGWGKGGVPARPMSCRSFDGPMRRGPPRLACVGTDLRDYQISDITNRLEVNQC